MRLSAWRANAPKRESMSPKVLLALDPVLATLGAEADPHCWVAWGEDPGTRFTILVPVVSGLAVCSVRVNVPQEGPHISGKLVRWSKVQVSDLGVDGQGGHRLLSFQIEQHVMRGLDQEADRLASFVQLVYAALDGRSLPSLDEKRPKASSARARGSSAAGRAKIPANAGRSARR